MSNEVTTVEMGYGTEERHWLVAIGSGGVARVLARCEYGDHAEAIADALRKLSAEELADLEERTHSRTKKPDTLFPFRRSS